MEKSDLAGKTVKIKEGSTHPQVADFAGSDFVVEDYWMNVGGKSWMFSDGNIACMIYGMRVGVNGLPTDDDVLYGKIGPFGHLVHRSEIDV